MRYTGKLTLVFLLVLYIGPMIFISSYGHTAILAEPNTVKDFSPSAGEGWFDEDWAYRKSISINGSSGAGTDYQVLVNVTYDSDMQADFDDLRFTDDGGITEIDYWIESYVASTYAVVWVEFSANLDTDQSGYMYYNNSAVSTTSDGNATFPFFDDFEDDCLDTGLWTETGFGGSYTETDGYLTVKGPSPEKIVSHSVSGYGNSYAFGMQQLTVTAKGLTKYLYAGIYNSVFQDFAMFQSYNNVEKMFTYDTAGEENAWSDFISEKDFEIQSISDIKTEFFVDDVSLFIHTTQETSTDKVFDFEVTGASVGIGDYVRIGSAYIRKCIDTEPILDSFGDEESYDTYPHWYIIGTAILLFSVTFDMWGLNTAYIILGLVMIPVSTIYLAYGAKNDRSSNRLFYGLIIFMVGCGLFIGGILP